ncbi:chorismate mutase [Vibrio porteresiae]|uniref:chorismate mutase n=1 Tax=Vibrio porteresiae DSM 19223 TaxID=1123496 RepID=A0ABZ0QIA0_9VIBR|nr:chorismate mutase [Vibrio porteresiae]WPC75771.1 chorismate mutase [Vibrio porteresiae DSM 19223]
MNKLLLAALLALPTTALAAPSETAVFKLINDRMSYMPDVALYKANNHLAIEDLKREEVVLEKSKAASAHYSLDSDSTEDFTVSLMAAAKAIQYRYRADLLSATSDDKTAPRDLNTVVRPALIKLGSELNESIAEYLKSGHQFTANQYPEFQSSITAPYLHNSDKKMIFTALQKIKLSAATH